MYRSHGLDRSFREKASECPQPEKRDPCEDDNLGAELAKLGLSPPNLNLSGIRPNAMDDFSGRAGHDELKASGVLLGEDPSNLNNSVYTAGGTDNSDQNWE